MQDKTKKILKVSVPVITGFVAFYYYATGHHLFTDMWTLLLENNQYLIVIALCVGILIGVIPTLIQKKNLSKSVAMDHTIEYPPLLKADTRTKVCLLFPLSGKGKEYILGDVLLQLEGYSKVFLDRDAVSEKIDFRIFDHKNDYDHAFQIIQDQFKNGANYFVCTMSQVAVKLAAKVQEKYKSETLKPILIFTVAGTTEITDQLNHENIFRFYIRVTEEVDTLIIAAEKCNSVGLIIVPSIYGFNVRESFIKKWNVPSKDSTRKFIDKDYDVITLPENPSQSSLTSTLKMNETVLKEKDVLLVALYGAAVYDIVLALDELKIKPHLLLFTSTFHFENATYEIKEKLNSTYNWQSCVPKLKSGLPYKEEVVKDFTYRVIDQLVKTISDSNNSVNEFQKHWKNNYPKDLDISFENGDSKITLKTIDKTCV